MTINYDHERLERRLGGEVEPSADSLWRLTARVLTDSDPALGYSPAVNMRNARHWLMQVEKDAYERGLKEGWDRHEAEIKRRLGLK